MNETALLKDISEIGSIDGPTSIFIAGKLSIGVFAALIIIGLLIGFFGLKLVKVIAAFLGFLIGSGAGAAICTIAGIKGIASVAVILVCAVLLAVVSFLVYKLGVFVMIFLCSLGVLVTVIPLQNHVIGIIELAVALVLAILAAIFAEPMIIVITGIAGGFLAGPAILDLAGITDPSWLRYVAGIVAAFLGLMVQFMMQSRKIGKKEKIKSEHIKEQVSMENEVEKARMVLDDELDEKDSEEHKDEDDSEGFLDEGTEEPEGYLDEDDAEEPEGYLDEDDDTEEPEGYLDEDDNTEESGEYLDEDDNTEESEEYLDDDVDDIEIKELDLDDIPSDEESEE